jgi:hypothetical protein
MPTDIFRYTLQPLRYSLNWQMYWILAPLIFLEVLDRSYCKQNCFNTDTDIYISEFPWKTILYFLRQSMTDCVNEARSYNANRSIDISLLYHNALWPFFSLIPTELYKRCHLLFIIATNYSVSLTQSQTKYSISDLFMAYLTMLSVVKFRKITK